MAQRTQCTQTQLQTRISTKEEAQWATQIPLTTIMKMLMLTRTTKEALA